MFAAAVAMVLGVSGVAYAANGDAQVDTSIANPPVSYPDPAQRNSEQGTVRMLVKVSAFGRPLSVKVVQSSGFDDLDSAAAAGVLRWHYIPATYGSDWADVQVVYQVPPMTPGTMPSAPANH